MDSLLFTLALFQNNVRVVIPPIKTIVSIDLSVVAVVPSTTPHPVHVVYKPFGTRQGVLTLRAKSDREILANNTNYNSLL
jgi:hypothetical protein